MSRWKIYNRRFLVNPFQLRLVGVAVFHFVLVVLIFATALFAPIVIKLESGDISSPHVQAAAREFLFLHTRLWAPLFGAFLLLVLHNIVVTHRIAGPLYRFRRYFEAVGEGDLSSPIRVRNSDYLKPDAKIATRMVESLREKIARVEEELEQANAVWIDLGRALRDGAPAGLQQKIGKMGDGLEQCSASLRVFKTGGAPTDSAEATTKAPAEPVELEV
ncbi:MAG: methyl-accepting chemotaxis protein [Candidatus Krumholzibacteria bacterium]|nr:methyl-accepting chemotaxis protein [Candidatus Krumholzibacteria bacterium]